jgi:hypothetical protein
MDVGVEVGVVVGGGSGVPVGGEVGVSAGSARIRSGMLQERAVRTSSKISSNSFFMKRTIHGRRGGVKERREICD